MHLKLERQRSDTRQSSIKNETQTNDKTTGFEILLITNV